MGFSDRIKKLIGIEGIITDVNDQLADIRLSVGSVSTSQQELTKTLKERRRTLSKPIMYANPVGAGAFDRSGTKQYHGPMYDLAEIARVMDIEAYVNQSVRKHREQILKEGYFLSGEDEDMVDYVKQRIFEMELISGYMFEETIRDFATSLIAYGTSFLVLKRDETKSSGSKIKMYGKLLEPIAAIYHMDPTAVSVKLNDLGHATRWRQKVDNPVGNVNEKYFPASEVIAATVDRKPGFVFGTPYILPVIDDVRALRRLEELAEIIARKYAVPSIHWKVGDEKNPPEQFDDNTTEMDIVRREVEMMTPEGGIVTSYRINHEVVASQDGMMNLTPLIEYYEARVLGGLRLSPVDLGRGDVSKASAGASSKSLRDSSRDFQAIIESKITYELILPLLLEGGFDVKHDSMVKFKFPMIDREEERANQQHGADMFNSSVISCTEFRRDFLGKKELTPEEMADTNSKLKLDNDIELAKVQGQITAAKTAASSSSSGPSASSSKNAIQNKVRPKNQNGRKPAKTAITANNNLEDNKKLYTLLINNSLGDIREEIKTNTNLTSSIYSLDFKDLTSTVVKESMGTIEKVIDLGVNDAMSQIGLTDSYTIPKRSVERFFKNYIRKSIYALLDGTSNWIIRHERDLDSIKISAMLDQFDLDLKFLLDKQIDIAYRFGFVRALRHNNIEKVDFVPLEDMACEECIAKGPYTVSLAEKDMPYNYLLSTHSDCAFNIELTIEKGGGKSNE